MQQIILVVKNIFVISLFSIIVSGCNKKNNTEENVDRVFLDSIAVHYSSDSILLHYNERKEIPFHYANSQDILYKGAFNVSPDYFAELILDTEKGELLAYINGRETLCDLSELEDKSILEVYLNIRKEDVNNDGYVDFILTPNYSARYPKSYVYHFDKEFEYFIPIIEEEENAKDRYTFIDNTIGFITFNAEDIDSIHKITFLNPDNTVWMDFDSKDFSEGRKIEWHEEFSPWALDSGIGIWVIRCVGQDERGYYIIVNENSREEKLLLKHENICFNTIEEHLLGLLISFNIQENPIRETPDADGAIISIGEISDIITVNTVIDDWIKIEDSMNSKELGWIKWRDGNRFLIGFYYSV